MALPIAWLWGFSVDDAWIIARVAGRIAAGEGHRFNAGGPPVDAVTPLGFAFFLAPAAHLGIPAAHHFAKCLGALCGIFTGAWLGWRVSSRSRRGLFGLVYCVLCAPLAAWCVAGMETGVIVGLVALAVGLPRGGAVAAGVAAGLRPELLPYAVTLSIGRVVAREPTRARLSIAALLAVAPALGAAAIRAWAFGSVIPLSAWAKPSDASHGAFYVAAALLWTGAVFLVGSPLGVRRVSGEARAVLVASAVHGLALVLVGGDWMPFFRLFVPVLPGLILVASELVEVTPVWATTLRFGLACGASAWLLLDKGPSARRVAEERAEVMAHAAPHLEGARVVAALDVGWVGASTQAEVVDLAGVTDPRVGRLPGSHTAKRLPRSLLIARQVDAVVLLSEGAVPHDPWASPWSRQVEINIASQAKELGFVLHAALQVPGGTRSYAVLRLPK